MSAEALAALFGRVFSAGVPLELSGGLNFTGGLTARLNKSSQRIDISAAGSDALAVTDYETPTDGAQSAVAGIEAAIAAAAAAGIGVVVFPAGEYLIDSTVTITTADLVLVFRPGATVTFTDVDADCFVFTDAATGSGIVDAVISGSGTFTAGALVHLQGDEQFATGCRLDRGYNGLVVDGFGSRAFVFDLVSEVQANDGFVLGGEVRAVIAVGLVCESNTGAGISVGEDVLRSHVSGYIVRSNGTNLELPTIDMGGTTTASLPAYVEGATWTLTNASAAGLFTVNGLLAGQTVRLRAAGIVARTGAGNLTLQGDCELSSTDQVLSLVYTGSTWLETGRTSGPLITVQAGSSATAVAGWEGSHQVFTNSAPVAGTLPAGLRKGFSFTFAQDNSGQVTWSAGAGATLEAGPNKTAAQGSVGGAIHEGGDNWRLFGDLTT